MGNFDHQQGHIEFIFQARDEQTTKWHGSYTKNTVCTDLFSIMTFLSLEKKSKSCLNPELLEFWVKRSKCLLFDLSHKYEVKV